jgi:hypothetical protein
MISLDVHKFCKPYHWICSHILQGIALGFGRFPYIVQGVPLASLVEIPVSKIYKGCPIGFHWTSSHFAKCTPKNIIGYHYILQEVPLWLAKDFFTFCGWYSVRVSIRLPHVFQIPCILQWGASQVFIGLPCTLKGHFFEVHCMPSDFASAAPINCSGNPYVLHITLSEFDQQK